MNIFCLPKQLVIMFLSTNKDILRIISHIFMVAFQVNLPCDGCFMLFPWLFIWHLMQFAVDGSSTMRDSYQMGKHHDLCLIVDLLLCCFIILSWFILAISGQENGGNYSDLRKIKAFETAAGKGKGGNITEDLLGSRQYSRNIFLFYPPNTPVKSSLLSPLYKWRNWNSDYVIA